jgi:hypothetical protein
MFFMYFIELYTKQTKSGQMRYGLDMNLFIEDILSIETNLGGYIYLASKQSK